MKALKLFLLLLLVFIVTIIEFTCIYYSYKEEGRYVITKLAFAFQRDLSFIAIGILTLSSFTAFFTLNKKIIKGKTARFLSFYLFPLCLIIGYCIFLMIDNFSLERQLLEASVIAIPFLVNLTLAYLFYLKILKNK